jgi:uncharacterized protein YcbX
MKVIGHVCELVRYPVKSMAGVMSEMAFLGWHGLAGDRRFAFRRMGDVSGFPWLTASRHPDLVRYQPFGLDDSTGEPLPTHVRTPAGASLALCCDELLHQIADRFGSGLEFIHLKHGIFDDAAVSLISLTTIAGIGHAAGVELDRRRFRANIVIDALDVDSFLEDAWVGGTLLFGDDGQRPAVCVTKRDARCVVINLDPDTGAQDARVLKAVVGLNENNAGVYGTVVQTGTIRVGQTVSLIPGAQY